MHHSVNSIMQKITIFVFLAMIAVSTATFCSESEGLCAPRRTKNLKEASDRNEMARSRPKDVAPKLKMEEAESSSTKSQNVPPAKKVESQVTKTESKAPVSSSQSKPPVSTENVSTPVVNIAPFANALTEQSVSSKVTIPVLDAPAKPTVSATKTIIPVINAQTKPPIPATDNIPVMNNQPRHSVSTPIQRNQPPVVSPQAKTSVLPAKNNIPATKAQERQSTPAQQTQNRGPAISLTKATTQVQRTQGSRPQASSPTLVLVLNVQEELNPRFKFEKKVGEKLDWSFICEDESMAYQRKSVKAHKSVVVKADFDKTMEVAKILQMKDLISILQDDVVLSSNRR